MQHMMIVRTSEPGTIILETLSIYKHTTSFIPTIDGHLPQKPISKDCLENIKTKRCLYLIYKQT